MKLLLLLAGDLPKVHEAVVPPGVPPELLQLGGDPTVPLTLLSGAGPLLSVVSTMSPIGGDGLLSPQELPLVVPDDGDPPVPLLPLPSPDPLLIEVVLPSSVPQLYAKPLA